MRTTLRSEKNLDVERPVVSVLTFSQADYLLNLFIDLLSKKHKESQSGVLEGKRVYLHQIWIVGKSITKIYRFLLEIIDNTSL